MSKTLPYFRWYPADAETDAAYLSLTEAELGLFHRCLNHSWLNGGVPADSKELAGALRISERTVNRLWPKVSRMFTASPTDLSKLLNSRQEEERTYATKKSAKATDAVRTRYERNTDELPRAYESVCGSEVIKKIPFSDFPKTHAAITERFPTADVMLTAQVVQAASQAYVSVDRPKIIPPTDEVYAEAVEIAARQSNGQNSAGLFKRTVPTVITNWAKNGRNGHQKSIYHEWNPEDEA